MQVVGITNQQEFWVASKERKFRINEMLVVEDEMQGTLVGEVTETMSYNRYIPFSMNSAITDSNVIKSLETLGYDINSDTIHVARMRLLIEAEYPVATGSNVRIPVFKEVQKYLIQGEPQKSALIGMIKSTENVYEGLDEKYKNVLTILENSTERKQDGVPFYFDLYGMHQYPHIGVFGGSGSGKSFSIRVLLEELMKKTIPTVVFDPHFEMNFSENTNSKEDYKNRYKCFTVGQHVGVKFTELSTNDLKNLLQSAGFLTDGMISAIDSLHKKRDTYASFYERVDLLAEGLEVGKYRVDMIAHSTSPDQEKYAKILELINTYGIQVNASSVKGLVWRLRRLQQEGIFNNDISPIIQAIDVGQVVVIQGNMRILQVFASYILNNIYQKRRLYKDVTERTGDGKYFPPFMIVTDEAHNFAPKGMDVPTKDVLREIAQEGRKYGIFMVLATQRPSLLDETITAQLNSKFIFRIVRASDIDTIKEETDISPEEAKRLPYLQSGDAFISSAMIGRTVPVRVRKSDTVSPHISNPFDELKRERINSRDTMEELIKGYLPISEESILKVVEVIYKDTGKMLDQNAVISILEMLVNKREVAKLKTPFGIRYQILENEN